MFGQIGICSNVKIKINGGNDVTNTKLINFILGAASQIKETETYKYIKLEDTKLQVDSAIRDGNGAKIDTTYAKKTDLNNKQNKLIAGDNITIDQETNTISATGSGFLPEFTLENAESALTVVVEGLKPGEEYHLKDSYTKEELIEFCNGQFGSYYGIYTDRKDEGYTEPWDEYYNFVLDVVCFSEEGQDVVLWFCDRSQNISVRYCDPNLEPDKCDKPGWYKYSYTHSDIWNSEEKHELVENIGTFNLPTDYIYLESISSTGQVLALLKDGQELKPELAWRPTLTIEVLDEAVNFLLSIFENGYNELTNAINEKPNVSVSNSGTSEEIVDYITINENEYKIGRKDKLNQPLTAAIAVGGVSVGDTFAAGTTIEEVLRKILTGTTPPPMVTGKIYWGVVNEIPPLEITEDFVEEDAPEDILANGIVHYFTADAQYECFAYPKEFGLVKHIYQNDLIEFDLLPDFVCREVVHNDKVYYMFYSLDYTREADSKYQFLWN